MSHPSLGETPEEKTALRLVESLLKPRGWTDQERSLAYGLVLREYFNEEYQDNLRFARSWIAEEMDEYERIREGGCCGSIETSESVMGGGSILFGFNYGH